MIVKHRVSSFFKLLALTAALAMASSVHGDESTEVDATYDPWAFNLTLYMWFPGLNGDFPLDRSTSRSI